VQEPASRRSRFQIRGPAVSRRGFSLREVSVAAGLIATPIGDEPCWELTPEQVLVPAFHDHHTHLIGTYRPAQGPHLDNVRTRSGALDAVARWLREQPGHTPVLGEGWDESIWDDPRPLTGADLDRLGGVRPIGLRRVDGHIATLNTVAWKLLTPEGIEADPVTGTITESLAMGLPARWAPPFEALIEGARTGQREAARRGVAAIDEMGRLETLRAFRVLEERGELALRVRQFLPLERLGEILDGGLRAGESAGLVRVVGLKGFLDGSIGARTAAVGEAFRDRGDSGLLLWETEELAEAVRGGVSAGFSIALHAIGRRAVRQALEVYARLDRVPPGCELRVEHAEEVDNEILDLSRRHGVILSMQPNFTARWQGAGGMYERALGADRTLRLNPYGSAAAATAVLFGSDTMPFGPLEGLVGALAHPDARERLALHEAILAYTGGRLNRATAADPFRPGAAADLAVLRAPGGDLERAILDGTAGVCWTSLSGRCLWREPDIEIPADFAEATD
jgi:predicted amidohydrolase YtcJ